MRQLIAARLWLTVGLPAPGVRAGAESGRGRVAGFEEIANQSTGWLRQPDLPAVFIKDWLVTRHGSSLSSCGSGAGLASGAWPR